MSRPAADQTVFVTAVRSRRGRSYARLLIDSIRSFGGALSHSPIWLFEADDLAVAGDGAANMDAQVFPLETPGTVEHYWFAEKVWACAQAERMCDPSVQSLVWIAPDVLILRPPLLFSLGQAFDAAVRPVHITNVGLPHTAPLDAFWTKIASNAGVQDLDGTVETFVDRQRIRPYFNSHAFSINPSVGLLGEWYERFEALVGDEAFQAELRQDQAHQIFLHQAVLSALLATRLDPSRIRTLPPDYNYPYNLHAQVPTDRRAEALNDLACIAYEGRTLDPSRMDDIEIQEPLRSWLIKHAEPNR